MANIEAGNVLKSDLILSMVQDELTTSAVLASSTDNLSSRARPGIDRISIPDAGSFSAADKTDGAAGTYQALTYTPDVLLLDDYKHVPVKIEDKAQIQSAHELEADVQKRQVSALVRAIEESVYAELQLASASGPDHIIQYANTPTDTIQKADILEARRLLNQQNVPMGDRFMAISTDKEAEMLNIDDFIHADKYGSARALQTGELGMIYGFRVLVSTTVVDPVSLFYHRSHVAWAMQQSIKSEKQRAPLNELADEYNLSVLYGQKVTQGGKKGVVINASGA